MPEGLIRATARAVTAGGQVVPAPVELVDALVAFESRYGGLVYPMITGNGMEYGLDGEATGYETEYGWAFAGIVDGDWTWAVDVLVDGRTAMAPGKASYRVIDRSVDQRLEKHALLADVRYWPHQSLTVTTDPGALPTIATEHLPVAVKEATGPADMWWRGDGRAVHISLENWWAERDAWTVRCFTRRLDELPTASAAVRSAVRGNPISFGTWCDLCLQHRPPEQFCSPASNRQ